MKNIYFAALLLCVALPFSPAKAGELLGCGPGSDSGEFFVENFAGEGFRWDGSEVCQYAGRSKVGGLALKSAISASGNDSEKLISFKLDWLEFETLQAAGTTIQLPTDVTLRKSCVVKPGEACYVEFRGEPLLSVRWAPRKPLPPSVPSRGDFKVTGPDGVEFRWSGQGSESFEVASAHLNSNATVRLQAETGIDATTVRLALEWWEAAPVVTGMTSPSMVGLHNGCVLKPQEECKVEKDGVTLLSVKWSPSGT